MEQTRKYIGLSTRRKYYEYELGRMSEEKQQQLEQLVIRLVKEGAKDPLSWAFSELQEGIPQFARFMIIKSLYLSACDVEGNVDCSNDFDRNISKNYKEMVHAIGEEPLHRFLISYSKGMLYNMLGIFDEGNMDYESDYSWQIMQYDRRKETLGRPVSGLHEDFPEFGEQMDFPQGK